MKNGNWQNERTMTATQFKRIVKDTGNEQGRGRALYRCVAAQVAPHHQGAVGGAESAALLLRSLVAHGETPVVPKWEQE